MRIETVHRLFLTQAEKNILEKALDLCNLIHGESEGSEDWYPDAFDASAAIEELLSQVKDEEETNVLRHYF